MRNKAATCLVGRFDGAEEVTGTGRGITGAGAAGGR